MATKYINIWRYFEFEQATGGVWHFPEGVDKKKFRVDGVSIDTRTLEKGNLFVALKGENFDGVDFVKDAKEAGASALVVPRKLDIGLPQLVVEDTLDALQKIGAAVFREGKARNGLYTVAITGSNGKTTTKEITAWVLKRYDRVRRTPGNFNNGIGVPITLCNVEYEDKFLVLEMGANHFGEIEHLISLAPADVRVITSLGEAHLEHFKDIEGVARAKSEIFLHADEETQVIVNHHELDKLFIPEDYPGELAVIMSEHDYEGIGAPRIKTIEDERICTLLDYSDRFKEKTWSSAHMPWTIQERHSYCPPYMEGCRVPSIGPASSRYMAIAMMVALLLARRKARFFGFPEIKSVSSLEAYAYGRGRRYAFRKKGFKCEETKSLYLSHDGCERSELDQLILVDDAYNANPTSLRASVTHYGNLAKFFIDDFYEHYDSSPFPDERYQRIAILGQMNELGENALQIHKEIAADIAKEALFDRYYWCGKYAQEMCDAATAANSEVMNIVLDDPKRAPEILPPFGFVLLKASRSMKLEQVVESFKEATDEWENNSPYSYYEKEQRYKDRYYK